MIIKSYNLSQSVFTKFSIPLSPILIFSDKSSLINVCLKSHLHKSFIPIYEILLFDNVNSVNVVKLH